jgi:HK97 family phage major capsid protein
MTDISTYKPSGFGTTSVHNPHVRALADVFEILFAGNAEAKGLIEKRIPRELSVEHFDGKVYNARELLLAEGIAATPLVQIQYFNTVMEGARLVQCARQAFRMESLSKSNTIRLPFQSGGADRSPEVPEAAPYRNSNATYTYRDFTIKKYGEVAPITDEMISDSLYNTMALEVALLGEHCENALNYEMIGVALENSGLEYDAAETAASQGIKAIASAKHNVIGTMTAAAGGFTPDTIVMTTDFQTNLEREALNTNYWGAQQLPDGGRPKVLGLDSYVTNSPTSSTTYTWRYTTNGDIGAIVFNKMSAGAYVMREDITVEDFRDPLQDITSAKAKIRFGVNYGIANAISRIEY